MYWFLFFGSVVCLVLMVLHFQTTEKKKKLTIRQNQQSSHKSPVAPFDDEADKKDKIQRAKNGNSSIVSLVKIGKCPVS